MFAVESERLTAIAALEYFAYEITDKGLELWILWKTRS
jgi:hypothetical protein